MCAIVGLCLAFSFAACLSPIIDDQPSSKPDSSPIDGSSASPGTSTDDNSNAPTHPGNAGGSVDMGDPPPPADSSSGDAGVEALDAGPDSGAILSSQ